MLLAVYIAGFAVSPPWRSLNAIALASVVAFANNMVHYVRRMRQQGIVNVKSD
jgi:hypothetical protein